jgi:DNA polymerase III subunit delta'
MFFKDVIGQENIKKRLIRLVQEQRLSHALLFTGPVGTGKLALAIGFARYVSCRNKGENDSCGECPSCRKYNKLAHPDLHFVFPVFKTKEIKKPVSDDFIHQWREFVIKSPYFTLSRWLGYLDNENAQGLIYEKESDSVIKKMSRKPFESEYKVMIIWLPEKMHDHCSNKLLKVIEEPPEKTLFLMVTEDEEGIISTIRSRCQIIKVPYIDNESMKEKLISMKETSAGDISNIVHLAGGDYLKALDYLNPDEDNRFFFSRFQEMMRLAYQQNIIELMEWSDRMAEIGRDRQKAYFAFALRLIREYFIMNLKRSGLVYLNNDEFNWGENFSPYINERNIIPFAKEFEDGIRHISMNGNPRIIFFDTALRTVKLVRR